MVKLNALNWPISYLKAIKGNTLFLFDEPTTGLHFDDVKTTRGLQCISGYGSTVLVIEHDLDVIQRSDYLIEIGPKGGEEGGQLLYCGQPEGIMNVKGSPTAASFLSKKNKVRLKS